MTRVPRRGSRGTSRQGGPSPVGYRDGLSAMELDPCGDLLGVRRLVPKRSFDLVPGETRLRAQSLDGVWLRGEVGDPHGQLPHIRSTDQPCPPPGWAVAECNQWMLIATDPLFGIPPQTIGQGLPCSPRPQADPSDEDFGPGGGMVDSWWLAREPAPRGGSSPEVTRPGQRQWRRWDSHDPPACK